MAFCFDRITDVSQDGRQHCIRRTRMPGADAARETSSNKVPNLPPSVFSKISSPDNAAASMRMKASLNCNRFVVASRFMSTATVVPRIYHASFHAEKRLVVSDGLLSIRHYIMCNHVVVQVEQTRTKATSAASAWHYLQN